jgi:hypothetical protein
MFGKELELVLKDNLFEYFNKQGFEYYHIHENSYFRKNKDNIQFSLEVQSKLNSIGGYNELGITFWNIEDILIEIGKPNFIKEDLLKNRNFRITLLDNQIRKRLSHNDGNRVETSEDCRIFCKSIIQYMETEGSFFFERYSYLPNILEEMNRLEQEGRYWHQGDFMLGQTFFTGLIISKLCNDSAFDQKVKLVEGVYYPTEHNLQEYIPYLEKLKERLKTVEPIYNHRE